jgi:hypothetical protein
MTIEASNAIGIDESISTASNADAKVTVREKQLVSETAESMEDNT